MNWILVAAGGASGAVARYGLGLWAGRTLGTELPFGTFIANLLGGLLMGLLVGWLAFRGDADQERWRLLLGVGALGGFTTFSAFSLETALMIERRHWEIAAIYVTASVLLSVAALFVGLFLGRRVFA
jgi:CrcB protein